jgi:HEAT repeat protein
MKKLLVLTAALLVAGCSRPTGAYVEQLKAPDAVDRLHAVHALGDRPNEAPVVVPALSEALKDQDAFVRRDAAHALARIGPQAQAAIPALRPLLKDRNLGVRKAAENALKKIDTGSTGAG